MTQVLDYSAGRPGALAIIRAGYAGAVRYIGYPGRVKCTDAAELDDFSRNGIGMALVHENTLTDWRGGYSAGQIAAQRSRDHANSIGFPGDRPVYLTVDQDVVTPAQFDTMLDYLRGAGSVLGGPHLVGVYGEADVIDRARSAGVAAFFWQTAAWSRGRRTAATLFQHIGTVTVNGIECDVNDPLQDDWGQHNMEDTMSAADAYTGIVELLKDVQGGRANDIRQILVDLFAEGSYNAFASVTKDMASGAANDLATVWRTLIAAGTSPLSDDQLDKVAAALAAHVGDDVANALGQRLITPSAS